MKLNSKKELDSIVYGETSVKILHFRIDKGMQGFKPHWHDRIELHFVKSGTLRLNCNEEEIIIKSGELSIVSPTFLHSGVAGSEGAEYYVLMFDINDLYSESVPACKYIKAIAKGDICFKYKTDLPQITQIAANIINANLNRKNYHPLEIVGSLYNLLGLLCYYCIDSEHSIPLAIDKFDDVINYINANFTDENISVNTISKKFNYEKSYFCRKFKKVTGITATKYINIQRLEHAAVLLKKTDKSIKEIAVCCGYHDISYFTNCFTKFYNVSPQKYRAEHTTSKNA